MSDRLEQLLATGNISPPQRGKSPAPVWLIAYPDHFQSSERSPLAELHRVLRGPAATGIDGVHILPFFPWSSDGGFSVKDYNAVDDRYGTWDDVESIATTHTLMFDAVINHMSIEGEWFQKFLAGDPEFAGFFRTSDPTIDHSAVVRPRTHPLLTPFTDHTGDTIHVWTTFSADQADLDYTNPEVLLRVIETLLGYVSRGATAIRLDAVGFLWKDEATSSIHLPQTHDVIKLLRSCLDEVAPGTILISETNVPHTENVSYLAIDTPDEPEVGAVYQFPLAPLVAYAALTGDTAALANWAGGIDEYVGPGRTFLNFLASHDGIGLRPAEGLLADDAVAFLAAACSDVGGQISYRSAADGAESPYELNTTWFDLMGHAVDEATAIKRHLATHAVMLALPGIAAIYAHSLFGSNNDQHAFAASGHNRDLNRARFSSSDDLDTPRARAVRAGLAPMLEARRRDPSLHAEGKLRILEAPNGIFAIERTAGDHRSVWRVNLTNVPLDGLLPYEIERS